MRSRKPGQPGQPGSYEEAPNAITKKTLGDRAYMCAAPKLWNSFPYHMRNEIDFGKLKILLKTHFFNLAFN